MQIFKLIAIKVRWEHKKKPSCAFSNQSKSLKRVLSEFIKSIYDVAQLDYNGMFEMITDEIHKQGVQEPAMVSWLSDQQKKVATTEWRRRPTDISFIKSIPNPCTLQFNHEAPNFNYFMKK